MFDFDEAKPWIIGVGVFLLAIGSVAAMTFININSAVAKCEAAGYAKPNISLAVTSCPADEDYSHDSLALVVGNVANSPKPTITDEVKRYIQNSIANTKDNLDMYIYSATPSGLKINLQDKKIKRSGNVTSFVKNSEKKMSDINQSIQQQPSENGADYFNNIVAAANAAKSSPKVESPLVVVIGSGLSDTQPLNFADADLLHSEPKTILDSLKKSGIVAPGALSGVKIVWSGLGVTVTPQKPLDAKERSNLRLIYQLIFEQMGATFVTDDTVMASDSIETDYTTKTIKVDGISGGVVVYKLGESSIDFAPETAVIKDESKAAKAVGGIIESYMQCKSVKIAIEGYQARPDGKVVSSSTLSQNRANAVKNFLITKGLPESSINAIGKGSSDFEGRVDENNADGKWDSVRAQANRVVLVKISGGQNCFN